jgi:hypothetical protein
MTDRLNLFDAREEGRQPDAAMVCDPGWPSVIRQCTLVAQGSKRFSQLSVL